MRFCTLLSAILAVLYLNVECSNNSIATKATVGKSKLDGPVHHLALNESAYGKYLGLRPVRDARPERNAQCNLRQSDSKFACFPDVIYIGTSKSGTTSIAYHLSFHPLLQNVISKQDQMRWRSKEGHFWERETVQDRSDANDIGGWIKNTKLKILEHQEGFDNLIDRPLLIEYSPNYLVLDHVPRLLKAQLKYNLKFIVSLREPVSRTLSSWKFKAKEGLNLNVRDDSFNSSMFQGMQQAQCIIDCYNRMKSMKKCSIANCRAKFDTRHDGRNGKNSYYAHVVKSLYAHQIIMWLEYFPRSSFFVFTVAEYRKNPIGVMEALLNFLGLPLYDPDGKMGFTDRQQLVNILSVVVNETPYSSHLEQQILNGTVNALRDFFAEPQELLNHLLYEGP